jgi:hypothetical protein
MVEGVAAEISRHDIARTFAAVSTYSWKNTTLPCLNLNT